MINRNTYRIDLIRLCTATNYHLTNELQKAFCLVCYKGYGVHGRRKDNTIISCPLNEPKSY